MKSMLHEAATVQKAVEQAWHEAGKPSEFSIKILDAGKQGLFWFSRKPAIISISYDPKNATQKSHKKTTNQQKNSRNKNNNQRSNKNNNRTTRNKDSQREPRPRNTQDRSKEVLDPSKNNRTQTTPKVKLGWTEEAIAEITKQLSGITSVMQIKNAFTTKPERKTLFIIFNDSIHHSEDEQKLLFVSLSYLLMQFLKKTFKKKFNGYQLMLTTKAAMNNNEARKNNSFKQ